MACGCGCRGGGRCQWRHSWPNAGGHARGDAAAPFYGGRLHTGAVQTRHERRAKGADEVRTHNLGISSFLAPNRPAVPFGQLVMTETSARRQEVVAPANSAELRPVQTDPRVRRQNHPALQGPEFRFTKVTTEQVEAMARARTSGRRR
jgi:hypothetical protein